MNYSFQRLVESWDGLNLAPYCLMTFPSLIGLLKRLEEDPRVLAVEAKQGELAIGLALAAVRPDRHSAKVLSLFVKPEHRSRGVGMKLLTHLESIAKENGCRQLSITFFDSLPCVGALQKVLERSGWSPPELCFIELKGQTEFVVHSDWVWKKRPLPQNFEIFRWIDLTEEDRQSIRSRQRDHPWYPRQYSPFKNEKIESLNSLGLRYQGLVVGWMLTHRINPETIRYTIFFVAESVRNPNAVFMLVTESIRLQCLNGPKNFVHHYRPDSPIRKWAERHLGEHATINHLMKSTKMLAGHP